MSRLRLPDLGSRGQGWVIGQFILLGLVVLVSLPRVGHLAPNGAVSWLALLGGITAMAVGGVVVASGFRGLGPSLTPLPRPRDDAELVDSGVYARIRHPIYAGLILFALGWAFLTRSVPSIGIAVLLAAFLDAKARREERWLVERYDAYVAYRRRTKRFVPGLY